MRIVHPLFDGLYHPVAGIHGAGSKALKFLDESGHPQDRYFRFLDKTMAPKVLAEGIRDAYQDLYQVNTKAHSLPRSEIINKIKTLSQGSISESVADKMAMTLTSLAKHADFSGASSVQIEEKASDELDQLQDNNYNLDESISVRPSAGLATLGGLHYIIQIILPESRDPKVYDALFRSLREHLIS